MCGLTSLRRKVAGLGSHVMPAASDALAGVMGGCGKTGMAAASRVAGASSTRVPGHAARNSAFCSRCSTCTVSYLSCHEG